MGLVGLVFASILQLCPAFSVIPTTRFLGSNALRPAGFDVNDMPWRCLFSKSYAQLGCEGLGRSRGPALWLQMQFRGSSRGGGRRGGRGGGRGRGRGKLGFDRRNDRRGDGGMSTDYVRGGVDPIAELDDRLDRFVENEMLDGLNWGPGFDARGRQDGAPFDAAFVPRGLGRNNFYDEDLQPGKVQRGRVSCSFRFLGFPCLLRPESVDPLSRKLRLCLAAKVPDMKVMHSMTADAPGFTHHFRRRGPHFDLGDCCRGATCSPKAPSPDSLQATCSPHPPSRRYRGRRGRGCCGKRHRDKY